MSAHQIATEGSLPEPFVRKLLQELARAGLASSSRGRHGGYRLTKAPSEMTVLETLEAFETLAPVPCLIRGDDGKVEPCDDDDGCAIDIEEIRCPTRAAWHLVDEKVRETLDKLTLSDLLDEVHERGLHREMIRAS
jgi:Rrf2 family protein